MLRYIEFLPWQGPYITEVTALFSGIALHSWFVIKAFAENLGTRGAGEGL